LPEGETTLSESRNSRIDWKLNDLLKADRLARTYAQHSHEPPELPQAGFSPWQPRQLDRPMAAEPPPAETGQTGMQDSPVQEEVIDVESENRNLHAELQAENQRLRRELEQVARTRFLEGVAKGKVEADAAVQVQLTALRELLEKLQDVHLDVSSFISYIENLALALARATVRQLVLRDEDYYRDLVRQALAALELHAHQDLQLFMNPDDMEAFKPALEGMSRALVFASDPSLERGDVRIVSGHTEIEENLQSRLDAAFASLTQAGAGEDA
jgi:flagellar biosynthesis/type III secretory pathway protein FliH